MNLKHLMIAFISLSILIVACGKTEPLLVAAPYVDVEAMVVSLYLDDLHSDCQEPEACPSDRVTLRINKIDRTGDHNSIVNLNVGEEVEFNLKYSARPAKLREDLLPRCGTSEILKSGSCIAAACEGPACPVSSPQYADEYAEFKGGYIVYHLPQRSDEIAEKSLSGLEENSRIRKRISEPDLARKEIGDYELI